MPDREEYNEHKRTRLLHTVEGLVVSGNHSTASRLLEDYLTKFPNDPRVLRSLGRLRLIQGRPEEAAELLERTIELMTELMEGGSISAQTNQAVNLPDSPPHKPEYDDFDRDDIDYSNSVASDVEANRKHYSYTERQIPTIEEESGNVHGTLLQPVEEPSWVNDPSRQETESCIDNSIPPLSESITEETAAPVRAAVSANSFFEKEMQTPHGDDTDEETEIVLPLDETMEDMAGEDSGAGDDKDLEFLLDTNAKKPAITYQDIDFQLLDEHLGELDEEPTPRELDTEVSVGGKVTREDRALQEAILLGHEFGWDNEGIMILAEVFTAYWWSSAKHSMRRELEAGLHPIELQLATSASVCGREMKNMDSILGGIPIQQCHGQWRWSLSGVFATTLMRRKSRLSWMRFIWNGMREHRCKGNTVPSISIFSTDCNFPCEGFSRKSGSLHR